MKNIFLINGHEYYSFSEGKLNTALVERMSDILSQKGCSIQTTTMRDEYDTDQEVEKHQWADLIIVQMPVNWMGVPWSLKKYMDMVYTGGMDGRLCVGDGRTRKDPEKQYGSGGALAGKKYMLSLTFNAPKEAFDYPSQYLFEGKSVDDLFFPMHMNFRFFGMEPLDTFVCYDVMKNPDIPNDFKRLEHHLEKIFS